MTHQDVDTLLRIIAGCAVIFGVCTIPALIDHYREKYGMRFRLFVPILNLTGRTALGVVLSAVVIWSTIFLLIK